MNDIHIVYLLVFLAIAIPIAFWRRDEIYSAELPIGDWKRLPFILKLLWRPAFLLETSLGEILARLLPGRRKRYAELLEISNLPLTPRRIFVCKAILAPVFALIASTGFLFSSFNATYITVAIYVAMVIGWIFPSMIIESIAQKRQEELVKSLPFAIDLMGSAMRAGLEFTAAMRYYTTLGTGGALEEEFSRVLREATLGKPMAESLVDMANRVRIKTFTAFAGVISYGTEIGASIADTLKIHGAEMRRERFALAEQKAARAPAVMIFPIAVFIMPAVFLIIFVPVILQFVATRGGL